MNKFILALSVCALMSATVFAQQDSTSMNGGNKTSKKHKTKTTTTTSDTNATGTTTTKHKNKKSGNGNNMDSSATMGR